MFGGLFAKVAAGAGLVLVAALAWQVHRASAAEEALRETEIAAAEARVGWSRALGSATSALVQERASVERLQSIVATRDAALAATAARLGELQAETDTQIRALEEATDAAPVEYQTCIAVPAPADAGRLLYATDAAAGAGGGDGDADRDRDAPGGADARLPDPAAGLGHADARRGGRAGAASWSGAGGLQRAVACAA